MTALAKKPRTVDLGGEILRLRGEIEAFIDGKVAALRAGPDGASLPPQMLRNMLMRNDECLCRAATRLLEESQ